MTMILSHTPGEWDGTFALALEGLIRDILDDGEIQVTLTCSEIPGFSEQRPSTLTACENGLLILSDGREISLLDVDSIEVP